MSRVKEIKYLITVLLRVVDGTTRYVDFYYDSRKKINNVDIEKIRDNLIKDYNKDKNIVDSITIININYLGKYRVKK